MTHTLKISDGTTTCDLLAGTDYKVITAGGWAPKRAQRSSSMMGGRSPYLDVDENPIALTIKGTNKGNCLTKLGTLSDLLDQAEAWAKGENVAAVYVEYWPEDSTLAASVKAVIVGPPSFGDFLQVPGHFDGDAIGGGMRLGTNNDPIILQFRRRGLWLGATETEVSGSVTTPGIMTTAAFTNTAKVLMPYDIKIAMAANHGPDETEAYLVYAGQADYLGVAEGEAMSETAPGAGSWTDTANTSASNDEVNRALPAALGDYYLADTFAIDNTIEKWAVFASVENQSATVTWDTYVELNHTAVPVPTSKTQTIEVSSGAKLVSYGVISVPPYSGFSITCTLHFSPSVASGAGHELDVDYMVLVGLTEESGIIYLPSVYTQTGTTREDDLQIKHRLGSHVSPSAWVESSPGSELEYFPYEGTISVFSKGNKLSVIIFGSSQGNMVISQTDAATAACAFTLTATKTEGYLTPL